MTTEQVKTCLSCQLSKPLAVFGVFTNRGKQGRRNNCNPCRKAQEKKRYAENPVVREQMKKTAKAFHFKKSYGLSMEDYEKLLNVQKGKCAICHNFYPTLVVDHSHSSNQIRALLCWSCNKEQYIATTSTALHTYDHRWR